MAFTRNCYCEGCVETRNWFIQTVVHTHEGVAQVTTYIPSIHNNIVENYRRMFREKYGAECLLMDVTIFQIWDTVFDDESTEAADAARVEEMKRTEDIIYRSK